jgi:hypothetical protein
MVAGIEIPFIYTNKWQSTSLDPSESESIDGQDPVAIQSEYEDGGMYPFTPLMAH